MFSHAIVIVIGVSSDLKLNGLSHSDQLDQSISFYVLLSVFNCCLFFFNFNQILIKHSVSKQWRP